MNTKQLIQLIKNGENSQVEFKQILSIGVYKTICAFLNTRGGFILIGVDDEGYIVGYKPKPDDMKTFYMNTLGWSNANLYTEEIKVEKRSIWLVKVRPLIARDPKARWDNTAYLRRGNATYKYPNKEEGNENGQGIL